MNFFYFSQALLIIFLNFNLIFSEGIPNGLYIIKNKANYNLCLKDSSLYFSSEESCQFHIYQKRIKPLNEYDLPPDDENKYYFIEEERSKKKIIYDELNKSLSASDKIDTQKDFSNYLWEFLPKKDKNNDLYYEIKSKLKKFFISYEDTKEKTTKAICESSWTSLAEDRDTKIKFIELYHEIEKKESEILEKEPIDVVIKYIDIDDDELNRKNMAQIDKDEQNEELQYSLRSIFKNIPWINKIFIVMPNKEIDFLKGKEEIKEKIVFIKDSALLGFDSSSPPAFQFNLHFLKKYNLSENFILMDDDYFISQPLKKSDLFYEENGKVYPYLISDEYFQINIEKLKNKLLEANDNIDKINYHSAEGFEFRKASTLSFVYKIFADNYDTNNLIGVEFTHNAIPLKVSDIKEVYDKIESDYKYSEFCLRGIKRTLRNLQPQILFMTYAKNKYNRPVNKISYKYYDLSEVDEINLENQQLFVLNREDINYDPKIFEMEEEKLNNLFPNVIKYEKDYVETSDKKEKKDDENALINEYLEKNKDNVNEKDKRDIEDEQDLFDMNKNEKKDKKENEENDEKNDKKENEENEENDEKNDKNENEENDENKSNEINENKNDENKRDENKSDEIIEKNDENKSNEINEKNDENKRDENKSDEINEKNDENKSNEINEKNDENKNDENKSDEINEKNDESKNEEINDKKEKEKEREKEKINDKEIPQNEKQDNEPKDVEQKEKNEYNFEEKFQNIEKEISIQKDEFKEKYENILEEIKKIKTEFKNDSPDNSLLITKLQELTEVQKELNERLSILEKENTELKNSQKEYSENIANNEKDNKQKEEANNAMKEIFKDIQDKNSKLEEKINTLSEEKNALINKLNSMQANIDDKDNKMKNFLEENDKLKSQLKEILTQMETLNNNLKNVNSLEISNQQNEGKINSLNNEIAQLKQKFEEEKTNKEKDIKINNEEKQSKTNLDLNTTYVVIFLFICVIVIYFIYKIYYGKDAGDPRKIRHMKLSSHSGYGSISSTSFM